MAVFTPDRCLSQPEPARLPAMHVVERNLIAYRRMWHVLISGCFEPFFYLLSLGVGLGGLIGSVSGPRGVLVSYSAFVAPALLAASAVNGAIYDSTTNVYWHIKYGMTFRSMLATPMTPGDVARGQIAWAQLRGLLYSAAFVLVMLAMGLVRSSWALLLLPAATLIGFSFAAAGFACTTFARTWQDFEYVNLVLTPMFLLSTTFYPLSVYPVMVRAIIQCTPMYQGITLMRELDFGAVGIASIGHVVYLVVFGSIGTAVASRRLGRLLNK